MQARMFHDMADTAPAMLWVTDPTGYCTYLSRGWYEYTGQTEETGLGYGWVNAVHPDDRALAHDLFVEASEQRTVFRVDYRLRRHDGVYRWAIDAGRPWFGEDGSYLGIVGAVFDIHDRKLAEERLRGLNERLEELVAERTSQIEALIRALTIAEQRERRRISQELHDDLQQTLFGLELRARLLTMNPSDDPAAVQSRIDDLRSLVGEAVRTTRRLALELNPPILRREGIAEAFGWLADHMQTMYGLTVMVTVEADAQPSSGDLQVMLIQFVRELLYNVVKHAGVTEARLSATRYAGRLRVVVSDEGEGFDPSHLAHGQSGQHTLGLYSIRERLTLFGGELQVETAPGAGTCITIDMPIETVQHSSRQRVEDQL